MTVSELFKKYDFESILPHLNHLFMVNSAKQNLRIAISDLYLVGSIQVHPLI